MIIIDTNSGHLDAVVVFVIFKFIQIRSGHTVIGHEHLMSMYHGLIWTFVMRKLVWTLAVHLHQTLATVPLYNYSLWLLQVYVVCSETLIFPAIINKVNNG